MSGGRGLRKDSRIGTALGGAARGILHSARDVLDDRAQPVATAVHEYRKSMKRWRALLRLLEPAFGAEAERLQHEARDLARELGAARDAQAALDALADLRKAKPGLPPAVGASLRRRIEKMRADEAAVLDESMRKKLNSALDAADAAASHWGIERIGSADLAEALAAGYRRARKALPADWPIASPDELHDFRKRVIVHRYQMELVAPLSPRMVKRRIALAQRLRERLGSYHDLIVLAGLAAKGRPLARWRARLLGPIAQRQAAHLAAAKRIAGRLFAERPNAFRSRFRALKAANGSAAVPGRTGKRSNKRNAKHSARRLAVRS